MAKTSINIQPCKVAQSERHNERRWELTEDQKMRSKVREELSPNNERAIYDNRPLSQILEDIKNTYKASKGKKMHAKATPLREGVVVIKEDTTLEDLKRFTDEVQRRWGPRCVQAYIHKDEGHWAWDKENDWWGAWKPNYHAHLVFDWTDTHGVTYKLDKLAMQQMQSLLAETLGMERGESSEREHLNATQYANRQEMKKTKELKEEKETVGKEVEKARHTHRELIESNEALKSNNNTLEKENNEKQALLSELETKIENIDEKLRQKATKGVVAFVANTFGSQETKYKKRKKSLEKLEADISEKKAELEYYSVKVEEISKQGDLSEDIDKAVKALESIPAGTTIRTVEVKPSEAVRELIKYKPEVYNTLTDWVAVIQDLRTLHVRIEKWKLEVGEEHNYKALWVAKPYDGEVKVQIQQDKENGKVYVAVKDTIQNEWQRVMDWVKNIVQKATERLKEGLETLKKVAEEIENKPKRLNLKDLPSVKSGLNDKIREAFGDNRPKLEDMASYVGLKKDKEETQQQSRGRKL